MQKNKVDKIDKPKDLKTKSKETNKQTRKFCECKLNKKKINTKS